jgi:uncharacterized protein DUF3618
MNEIPERIEREMFEIRSRMAPDVQDLKKHVEPQAVTKKLTARIKDRIRNAVSGTVGWSTPPSGRSTPPARPAASATLPPSPIP